ncbi:hypothetical protein GALMADRAFT_232943 [Galerina marginata CBS 339.88]|uniref:Uncharacterized protein n=1 Tax=Galerina marginata (strain CBS 339.88) TaxID=685588 RepID=A0A067SF01_GALM3|nr:hypothetical protein GALMADRAFT_232943 [Galerina marginata CBS 339.88]
MLDLIHAVFKHPDDFLGVASDLGSVRNYQLRMPFLERHRVSNEDQTTFIIGELLDNRSGTKLGAVGNRTGGNMSLVLPIEDGESIQDVFALGPPTSYGAEINEIWKNQSRMLKRYVECDSLNDDIKRNHPSLTFSWEDQGVLTVLWEKYITVDKTKVEVRPTRSMAGVVEGCFYEPAVLGDRAKPYLDLKSAALVQHALFDQDWRIIPPWFLSDQLKPGTLLLILVSLHCKDINLNPIRHSSGFYRVRHNSYFISLVDPEFSLAIRDSGTICRHNCTRRKYLTFRNS